MSLSSFDVIVIVGALLLGGFAKGISGMGVPIVATPILTVMFDLQTAIVVTIAATALCDVIMLARLPKNWALTKQAAVLMIFGICGIMAGSLLLLHINSLILSGVLGVVIIGFVATSLFSRLPTWRPRRWTDAAVGLAGGVIQGAAGASGPIISMYLLQMKLNRNEFLFMINTFFVMVDLTQFVSVYNLGLYTGHLLMYALLALIPTLLGLAAAFLVQKRISDRIFRHSVLLVVSLSAVLLLYKSLRSFF